MPAAAPAEDPFKVATDLLCSDAPRKVFVIATPAVTHSVTRDALMNRLIQLCSERGEEPKRITLSLDGFEPERGGLGAYVALLVNHGSQHAPEVRTALADAITQLAKSELGTTSSVWALLFSWLVSLEAPLAVPALAEGASAFATITPEELATQLLALLAADNDASRVVLHVPAESTLPDVACEWLMHLAERERKVALVFSATNTTSNEELVHVGRGYCKPLRFEVSQARPEEGAEAPKLPARDALEDYLASVGDDASTLREVLAMAALCGPNVPIKPLLVCAGVAANDLDRYIDRIDEALLRQSDEETRKLPLFDDLGYQHTGFPGTSVYRFTSEAAREQLMLAQPDAERSARATKVREFWGQNIRVATRGHMQLLAQLGEHAGGQKLAAGPRQRLSLWAGPKESDALERILAQDIKRGRIPQAALLGTAQRDVLAPPHQRLAWLRACAAVEGGIPKEQELGYAVLHADLLAATGRFDDAIALAEKTLSELAQDSDQGRAAAGLLAFLIGRCHRLSKRPNEAIAAFERAAVASGAPRQSGEVDHHNVGASLAEAGRCHAELGQLDKACEKLEAAEAEMQKGDAQGRVIEAQLALVRQHLATCRAQLAK